MSKATRKDLRGRVLLKGEQQRSSDGRYVYTYLDATKTRRYIYANDIVTLREKEEKLKDDLRAGIDVYAAGKATINITFDRYISLKKGLKQNTKSGYLYTYDHYIRDGFGKQNVTKVKYSDVMNFYNDLLNQGLSIFTVESIHGLIHPTLQLAVMDDLIRKNPSDGVMTIVAKNCKKKRNVRHALSIEEQRAFLNYIAEHPVYCHWWPIFTFLLGTGCRIGEALGMRWEDIDDEFVHVNHNLEYYKDEETGICGSHISAPKTEAGVRTIPIVPEVQEALDMLKDMEEEDGKCQTELDGYSGFIFQNRYHEVLSASSVDRAIKRIISDYNGDEILNAEKQKREPLVLPNFSAHHLRHTFATRLCMIETNLKVIMDILGHADIATTMKIYAEATADKKKEAMEKSDPNKYSLF